MDINLIIKIAGVGILVSVAYQILAKTGREEQAMFVTLSGVIIVLVLLVGEISSLFSTIRNTFGI